MDYFVNLPIFDKDMGICFTPFKPKKDHVWAPHRGGGGIDNKADIHIEDYKRQRKIVIDAIEKEQSFFIVIYCKIPILLSNEIRKEIFKYSEAHPDGKKENHGNDRMEGDLERDGGEGIAVSLIISFEKNKLDLEIDGTPLNRQSLEKLISVPTYNISLGCGPGFYYEYVAWITNKIALEFPEVGISDGSSGCCGCTFASTLYEYERFELPWKKAEYALSKITPCYFEPIKRLSPWGSRNKNYGEEYLCLINSVDLVMQKYLDNPQMFDYLTQVSKDSRAIKKDNYQEFCTMLYSDSNVSDEELVAATAVGLLIQLGVPKTKMTDWEIARDEFLRRSYLVSIRKNGHIGCEIWVRTEYADKMKEILSKLTD